jgi:hypothetical protein
MPEHITDQDLELLGDLGVDTVPATTGRRTVREQRIIAGFEEISGFVEEHGRTPEHGEDKDIFERLYAVRLDCIRQSSECRDVLKCLDSRGLLGGDNRAQGDNIAEAASDDELLAALGVEDAEDSDVTRLTHVRSRGEIRAAEEIALRKKCEHFEEFRPIFDKVQRELESGIRTTVEYKDYADIKKGDMFILGGQKVIVAELGEKFMADYERENRRLRVIFDNGTENRYLLRSLLRALYKTPGSRRITEPSAGPLFSEVEEEDDLATGYIYVLRSQSDHPFIAKNRSIIHKIGVTGGDVKSRVANAKKDPTYLLADVEIVATFKLANVNRKALEALLQKFFGRARLDLELKDRFGSQVEPREWFLVPLPVIDEAIQKIKEGALGSFQYDPETARLTPA